VKIDNIKKLIERHDGTREAGEELFELARICGKFAEYQDRRDEILDCLKCCAEEIENVYTGI